MSRTYPALVIRNDPMDRFYHHTILKNCKDKELKRGRLLQTASFNQLWHLI